jgi:hypothetical protein
VNPRDLTASAETAYDGIVNQLTVAVMRTRRWFIAFAVLMLGLAGAGLFPPVAVGETPVTLTPEIQSRLIAAEPIQGRRVDRQMFNGKPVIVTFFASW